ncbi:MAG TPA: hypothetical protein PK743_09410 [Luteimonas sp.]|nr:hypothetical protein [Luteimonas sp.]HRO27951.1 hypothetical protein [Luteimonas sp.]HRP72837.1 hypothetical protein [Luteimonas sp.]
MARTCPDFRTTTAMLLALLCAVALPGCGDGDKAAAGASTETPLPGPQSAGGAVTDMPEQPGPGGVPLSGEAPPLPPALLPADERFGLPPLEDNPEAGLTADDPAAMEEPTPADAAAVVRDYYAAIGARDFARAWALWSDDGRGSGQSPAQFAAGFADAVRIEATVGEPGPVEAAAGSRYVEVPVGMSTVDADGRVRRYAGRHLLRRAVVDGATAQQRAWRIASVALKEAVEQ